MIRQIANSNNHPGDYFVAESVDIGAFEVRTAGAPWSVLWPTSFVHNGMLFSRGISELDAETGRVIYMTYSNPDHDIVLVTPSAWGDYHD